MIENYNSETHDGHLPIRVLQHNIIDQFEKTSEGFIYFAKEVIDKYGLSEKIDYTMNMDENIGHKLKTPYVCMKTKEICVQETFLAYLWCMCYALKLSTNNLIAGNTTPPNMAINLMKYAFSLKSEYGDWDRNRLANPECYEEDQSEFIDIVNGIFVCAMNFILCHEFSHVSLRHIDRSKAPYKPNDEERRDFETEADREAIKMMMTGMTKDTEARVKIGITAALCSMLFLSKSVRRQIHPDTDGRILDAIDSLEIAEDEEPWVIVCASLNLWKSVSEFELHWENEKTFRGLFISLARQLP